MAKVHEVSMEWVATPPPAPEPFPGTGQAHLGGGWLMLSGRDQQDVDQRHVWEAVEASTIITAVGLSHGGWWTFLATGAAVTNDHGETFQVPVRKVGHGTAEHPADLDLLTLLVTIPEPGASLYVDVETLRATLDVPQAAVPDITLLGVCEAATEALRPHLRQGVDWSTHANIREAALTVAVQVWQARHAPGGQMVGLDLTPQATPHLLGPGLLMRVQGLISDALPYGGAVIA